MMEKTDKLQGDSGVSREIVSQLKALMIEHTLPLWAGAGWDKARGGFYERLRDDGHADMEAPRRVRVQARQIYSYATAARLGWFDQGRSIALEGLEYLLAKARRPDGGYAHMLALDGSVTDDRRDSYDHAFVLLALASVYALTKDAQVRSEIDLALRFLDSKLKSPHGGALEGVPHALPRRQNPQMHLFEAMIALYEATGEAQFQNRAGDYFGLFVANLFDQRTQTLGEYFEEDWAPVPPAVVEPGHQAEWVWLLRGFERNTGCPTGRFRSALLTSALRYTDPASGCLVDEGNTAGNVTRSTRRLWPQTEIAKAWIAQAETSEEGAEQKALEALARLEQNYLRHPVRGAWYDQFDANGTSLVKEIPASSFYHVICAIAEAHLVFEQG
jgi:mannose/cellobiose epimerase-like protein (N-acyl-D-glucosamine 2-epimerase family)